jgi:pimeloyl-ACP methyl ester carboxylesterase
VSPALAPTAVLVHGAWGAPDDWDDVVAGLDERGVACAVADLPTMRSIDATTTDDVDHVRELVLEAGGPVVLCGHSYGGMVITGLGADVPAVHLLYLAALVPDQGQAMEDLVGGAPAATTRGTEVLPDGSTLMAPWPVADGPYSADVLARMAARPRRRFAPAGWWTPVFGAAWRHAPSTYVLTSASDPIVSAPWPHGAGTRWRSRPGTCCPSRRRRSSSPSCSIGWQQRWPIARAATLPRLRS